MTDILDVHSHILPKLDDGASTGKDVRRDAQSSSSAGSEKSDRDAALLRLFPEY